MEDRYEFREEIRLWFDELLRSNKMFDDIGKVIKGFERDHSSRTLTKQHKNLIARELDKGKNQSLLSSSDDLDDEEMFPTPLTQPTQDDELMEEQSIRNGEPMSDIDDSRPILTQWRWRQLEAHADMKELGHSYIIAKQLLENKGYSFKSVENDESVFNLVKSTKQPINRVFNEQIVGESQSLMHFDFDCSFSIEEGECTDKYKLAKFAAEFRTEAQQYVTDLLLKYYNESVNNVDMRILQANRSTRDKHKFSLHIIVPGLKFANLKERKTFGACMKRFAVTYMFENNDWEESVKGKMIGKWADYGIYTLNRQIRMAENCKAGEKTSHLKYYDDEYSKPWPENPEDKFYASLLTRSENLNAAKSLPLPLPQHNITVPNERSSFSKHVSNVNGDNQAPPNADELQTQALQALRDYGDEHATPAGWLSPTRLRMTCNRQFGRTCPCGNHHDTQNFVCEFEDNKIYYVCPWTTQKCLHERQLMKKKNSNEIVGKTFDWCVARDELYTNLVDRGGKEMPTVRYFDVEKHNHTVDSTEMKGGKTHMIIELILFQFTPRDNNWRARVFAYRTRNSPEEREACRNKIINYHPYPDEETKKLMKDFKAHMDDFEREYPLLGEKVLLIADKRSLCRGIANRCKEHGLLTELYEDINENQSWDDKNLKQLIICLDSLHKVPFWPDLVVTDEIHEVQRSLAYLKPHQGMLGTTGKWNIFHKFKAIIECCTYSIWLSAHADKNVKALLDAFEIEAHWQSNKDPILGHLTYEFVNVEKGKEGEEYLYLYIFKELDAGKNIIVPCCEAGTLRDINIAVQSRYGNKWQDIDNEICVIHGRDDMTETERKRAIERINRRQPYRLVLFSPTINAGTSIDTEYDLTIMVLSDRSILASTVIQMTGRGRNLKENKVMFLCNARVKDWENYPGYEFESLPNATYADGDVSQDIRGLTSQDQVRSSLLGKPVGLRLYKSLRYGWFRVKPRSKPDKFDIEATIKKVLTPPAIEAKRKGDHFNPAASITQIMSEIDIQGIKKVQEHPELLEHDGLIHVILLNKQDEYNRSIDMVENLQGYIKRQGAKYTHKVGLLKELKETGGTETTKEVKALTTEAKVEAAQKVFEDDHKPDKNAFQEIKKKKDEVRLNPGGEGLDAEEENIYKHGMALATCGEEWIDTIKESSNEKEKAKMMVKLVDPNKQQIFRTACKLKETLADRGKSETYLRTIMSTKANPGKRLTDLVDKDHQLALRKSCLQIILCMGFDGPFDEEPQTIDDEKKVHLIQNFNALRDVLGDKKGKKRAETKLADLMKAVATSLKAYFFMYTKANNDDKKQTNEYRLTHDDAFPDADFALWEHYQDWTGEEKQEPCIIKLPKADDDDSVPEIPGTTI